MPPSSPLRVQTSTNNQGIMYLREKAFFKVLAEDAEVGTLRERHCSGVLSAGLYFLVYADARQYYSLDEKRPMQLLLKAPQLPKGS
jgi:hypothetical protein